MDIAEVADATLTAAKQEKTELIERSGGRADLNTMVTAFREPGGMLSTVLMPPHRDAMLAVAGYFASGLAADGIGLVFETFFSTSKQDPRTGAKWEPNSMGTYFDAHPGQDVVLEALAVAVVNRAGEVSMLSAPYLVTGTDVEWRPSDMPPTARFEGMVPDMLREAMQRPVVDPAEAMGASSQGPDMDRAIGDVATIAALHRTVTVPAVIAMCAEPGSHLDKALAGLADAGIVRVARPTPSS